MYTPYTSPRHSILCNENLVVLVEADNNRAHIHRTGSSVDDDGGDCDASAVVVAEEDVLVGWIADSGGGGGVIVACCSRCCNCRCYLRRSFVSVVAVASVLRVNALHRSACYVLFKIAENDNSSCILLQRISTVFWKRNQKSCFRYKNWQLTLWRTDQLKKRRASRTTVKRMQRHALPIWWNYYSLVQTLVTLL